MVKIPPEPPGIGGLSYPEEKRVAPQEEMFRSSHIGMPSSARTGQEHKIKKTQSEQVYSALADRVVPGAQKGDLYQIAADVFRQHGKMN